MNNKTNSYNRTIANFNCLPSEIFKLFNKYEFCDIIKNSNILHPNSTQNASTQKDGNTFKIKTFSPLGRFSPISFDIKLSFFLNQDKLKIQLELSSQKALGPNGEITWLFTPQKHGNFEETTWVEIISKNKKKFQSSKIFLFGHYLLMNASAKNINKLLTL